MGYRGLKEHKFNVVAVFDNNYAKIGRYLWNLEIYDISRLQEINAELRARIGIVAVPAPVAQSVADQLLAANICAILNFAPTVLRVPDGTVIRNVSFMQELAVLSYHLSADHLEDVGVSVDGISE